MRAQGVQRDGTLPPVGGGDGGRYAVVQFSRPVTPSDREALERAGAAVMDYVPEFAFVVRTDPVLREALGSLPGVRWVGPYLPEYRRHRALELKSLLRGTEETEMLVSVFPGEDLGPIRSVIESLGGRIEEEWSSPRRTKLKVRVRADALQDISSLEGIRWVEEAQRLVLHNNVSTDIMAVRAPRDSRGLYGQGQIVCVADTGLDRGSTSPGSLHDDFEDGAGNSRVLRIFDVAGDGDVSDPDGHGTHVAGSVLGNGLRSGSDPSSNSFPDTSFAGTAPKASLVFQAIMKNSTRKLWVPGDLGILFDQCRGAGARIQTNSWGYVGSPSGYNMASEDVDYYVWNNKDYLILFSAGNEGVDDNNDGVIDLYSVTPPATAKNCIAVGATEGYRLDFTDHWGDYLWGDDTRYLTEPIRSDRISDNPSGMAAFSSRGPCLDGRIKPDVVAPGTYILSTRSSLAPIDSFWENYDAYYAYMGGTSMAAPLTAGTAALLRDYLIREKGMAAPSAALIKAALIDAAQDISPGQYGTGPTQEIPNPPLPNPVEGWGRVNLQDAVYPQGGREILYFDETAGLGAGQFIEHPFSVNAGDEPLKAHLVWSDYPGTPAANGGLVNDLDLELVDPLGGFHYHRGRSSPDRTDNVEGVVISNPQPGTWVARVAGYNVPFGPQPYALVISGKVGPGPVADLGVAPVASFHSSGMLGGVFSPQGLSYVLTNNTDAPLTWSASVDVPWASLSSGGGTLPPRGNTSVTVSLIMEEVYDLSPGTHTGTLSFVNESTHSGDRQVAVSVEVQRPAGTWIHRVSPDRGGPGAVLTLSGYNFGSRAPRVYFVGGGLRKKAAVVSYSDTQVVCTFPTNGLFSPGPYTVELTNRDTKLADALEGGFTLMGPSVTGSDKASVGWYEPLSVTGEYFGTRKGTVQFENPALLRGPKKAKVSSWTDTRVTCTVPKGLPTGDYTLRLQNKVGSSTLTIHVTQP
jgi:subtilisin family serine protease